MSVLVIDVGTSGARSAIVDDEARISHLEYRSLPPSSPFPGMVEFDAVELADAVLDLAGRTLSAHQGPVRAVGISAQRASTVLWDRATGQPFGPALGWQDLRTVFDCMTANAEHGLRLAPNQSATKLRWLLEQHDPGRAGDVCFGTVDTWLAWVLSKGTAHITDRTNAAVTGLLLPDASAWSPAVCDVLGIPLDCLPTLVDTSGVVAEALALPGAPPLASLVGDQQASLIGQSCVRPGATKITFGTGGMLDVVADSKAPTHGGRLSGGTFPIVAWAIDGVPVWGREAIMLSAGTNVEWLVDDLGIIPSPADSDALASQCASSGGVVYVPALMGLGTPNWDYGARGALFGMTRGTGRPEIVRAVLEGVAHRGADLIEAAESDLGQAIEVVRVDGGMTANPTFVQALANASQRRVEVAPTADCTTLGAAYLAGVATGMWSSLDEVGDVWSPRQIVEPNAVADREQWAEAVRRTGAWIPDLSALDF